MGSQHSQMGLNNLDKDGSNNSKKSKPPVIAS